VSNASMGTCRFGGIILSKRIVIDSDMEGEITAVILAATEQGGMGEESFDNKTRHLIPQNDKPIIFHLLDTLLSNSQIKKVHIIVEERIDNFNRIWPCGENYEKIIDDNPIYKDVVSLHGQNFLTKVGTYEAVKSFIKDKGEKFPLLIVYGDSYVSRNFLNKFIDKFLNEINYDTEPIFYWGLTPPYNEKGNILHRQDAKRNDVIMGEDILEISEKGIDSPNSLKDTGMMLISSEAWRNIRVMAKRIHRPSPFGIFSFASIIRQSLIFKGTKIYGQELGDIRIKCILGHKEDYLDANYPWELLELGKSIWKDKISDIMQFDPKTKLVRNEPELVDSFGKESIVIQDNSSIRITDKNILFIGPCYFDKSVIVKNNTIIEKSYIGLNSIIESNVYIYGSKLENAIVSKGANIENGIIRCSKIKENSIIRNSFVGNDCFISNNTTISASTLEKNIEIHSNSIIENSIIMDSTTIFHNCLVVMSIIGKHVTLGVGVNIPCKRLNKITEYEPEDKKVTYFSDIDICKTEHFGAIIGDCCQIGSGAVVHPGRRVGKRSKIDSGYQVVKNLPPLSDTNRL
jgi:NDP-sugar pyrophosphorylase family protein